MALIKGLGFLAPTPRLAATLVNWRDGAPDAFHGANRMPPPVAGRPPGTRAPIGAVADYAVRLHATLGAEHAATSPLGAYLLLAAGGPAARGRCRPRSRRASPRAARRGACRDVSAGRLPAARAGRPRAERGEADGAGGHAGVSGGGRGAGSVFGPRL